MEYIVTKNMALQAYLGYRYVIGESQSTLYFMHKVHFHVTFSNLIKLYLETPPPLPTLNGSMQNSPFHNLTILKCNIY